MNSVTSNLADAALVVLGHGTTLNADSSVPVRQHAAELRRRKLFAEVREAFWKQEPQVRTVLAGLRAPRVFLVPFFISEGYFSERVIPQALGFELGSVGITQGRGIHAASTSLDTTLPKRHECRAPEGCRRSQLKRGAQTWIYCKPVGTHESMTRVLLARAREVAQRFPFPCAPEPKDSSLFVAGHGTEQSDNSRESVEYQAELIRALNLYADVHAVFLEEAPRIGECYHLARTRNIVMVPFFTSDGLHVREDIPVLLGEPRTVVERRLQAGQPTWRNPTGKHGKMVWYAPSVGTEPGMAEVILERVREAAAELA